MVGVVGLGRGRGRSEAQQGRRDSECAKRLAHYVIPEMKADGSVGEERLEPEERADAEAEARVSGCVAIAIARSTVRSSEIDDRRCNDEREIPERHDRDADIEILSRPDRKSTRLNSSH